MINYKEKLDKLFHDLVPIIGSSQYLAGELVRATNHIAYRFYNDGDHIGIDYGKETCNPAARFLASYGNQSIKDTINNMWEVSSFLKYEKELNLLIQYTVEYIDNNPETMTIITPCDMFDFTDLYEDYKEDYEDAYDDRKVAYA